MTEQNLDLDGDKAVKEKVETPDLSEILRHNQGVWRKRNRFRTISSPVEINPGKLIFGVDPRKDILKHFGEYIHPDHRKFPPILGISVLPDSTSFTEADKFYWPDISRLEGKRFTTLNELIVDWLALSAMEHNPLKKHILKDPTIPFFHPDLSSGRFWLDSIDSAITKGACTREEITDAFSRFHFQGVPDNLNSLLGKIFGTGTTVFNFAEVKFGEGDTRNLVTELMKLKQSQKNYVANIVQVSLFPFIGGSSLPTPGIINIPLGGYLTLDALHALMIGHLATGVIPAIGAITVIGADIYLINDIWNLKRRGYHEYIHAYGDTESHTQGLPCSYIHPSVSA